jgi:ATP-binding cassette subfamily B (MDR/TAP) protein 1
MMAADKRNSYINASAGLELAEKGEAAPPMDTLEQKKLAQQLHFDDIQTSFFALYRHATIFDLVIIAVSTVCAVVAGAVVPVAPVRYFLAQ